MISDQYEGSDDKIFNLLPVLTTPIFGVLFYAFFKHFRALGASFRIDDRGIGEIGGKGITLSWDEIGDIEINSSLIGMVEMKIRIVDRSGQKFITIYADHLPRGGRTILDELQRRLSSLFEKKTREYLSGQKHWNHPMIKDILRLEGDLLFIEFPKLKKQSIPLNQIRRVEWFPGAISGAQTGYLLIEHPSGKIKLPHNVSGLAFFLFALKYLYGLGESVNPEMNEELTHKMDNIRQSQAKSFMFRLIAFAFPLSLLFLGIALWEAWRLNRPEKPVFFGHFRDGDHISFDKAEFNP
jgi:hypothetical protein